MGCVPCTYACILHNKGDIIMLVAVLCVALFAPPPAAVAAAVTIATDRSSSIIGPIFRTQPAPQPLQCSKNPTVADPDATNFAQQPLSTPSSDCTNSSSQQIMESPDDVKLPQEIQPSTNETSADTASYVQ